MAEQQNIILILTENHNQWASGCYGNQALQTPNLDHLDLFQTLAAYAGVQPHRSVAK